MFLLSLLPFAAAQAPVPQPPTASEPEEEAPPPPEDLGLSPEELAEIEAALGVDAAADPAAVAATPPPSPRPVPGVRGAAQSMNPDISLITDVALAAFTSDEPLQSGGHDPTEDGFNLQQLELAVGGAVDSYLRMDGNIVFSQFGVEIEEIYATTTSLPGRLQLRGGQFLTRFGRANATHPHSWDFVDQAFPIGRVFGGEGNRGLGAEASWLTPLPWYVEIVASETMIGGEATSRTWWEASESGVQSPADLQTTAAIKQFFPLSSDLSLLFGLSWAGGPNDSGRGNRSEIWGADLYLKFRPITSASYRQLSLLSEWFHRRSQAPDQLYVDLSGYTQLAAQLNRRWGVSARHEYGSPSLDVDGEVVAHPLDPDWDSPRHRYSAAVTFWPTEFSRLRLQGAMDRPGWRPEPDYSAFLAFEFNAGTHGAHTF
jgi:hypothetical protein